MKNVSLHIENALDFTSQKSIAAYESKVKSALEKLHNGTGKGNDFLGWLHLPSSISSDFISEIEVTAELLRQQCDVVVIAGIVGYGLSKAKFNMAGLVLGLVLGPIVEKNLRNAIVIAQGNLYEVFIAKPITLVMLIIIAILFMLPVIQGFMKNKEKETPN